MEHDHFVPDGDDLHCEVKVSLATALCGFTHDIRILDKREQVKRLRKRARISSLLMQVLSGEGMSISKRPGGRGDLIVSFLIDFPENELTEE